MNQKCLVQLNNVTVAYSNAGQIYRALQDIHFNVYEGEWIGIVGRNGSGKSTLASVLTGICPISKGTLEFHDATLQMVFQNPEAQIVGETIEEEICFGMENQAVDPQEMQGRTKAVLEQVGLSTKPNQPVASLSGGQKQLLNIASCLAHHASILVFDEATAMLDPLSRDRVLDIAAKLHRQGQSIIWITQWMEELSVVDRMVALDEGRIVFDGHRDDFFYAANKESGMSPCESMGFTLPYSVQVAQQLLKMGYKLNGFPVSAEQLVEAVTIQ